MTVSHFECPSSNYNMYKFVAQGGAAAQSSPVCTDRPLSALSIASGSEGKHILLCSAWKDPC